MTAPSILRRWRVEAIERIEAHATSISSDTPELSEQLEALRSVRGRDPLHEEAHRLQALADLLEGIDRELVAGGSANGTNLSDKNVIELREIAKERGIAHYRGMKKHELVETLEG